MSPLAPLGNFLGILAAGGVVIAVVAWLAEKAVHRHRIRAREAAEVERGWRVDDAGNIVITRSGVYSVGMTVHMRPVAGGWVWVDDDLEVSGGDDTAV